MREFNYSKIREQKWDSDILGYIAAIYKEAGKQEQYLKQRLEELQKLVAIAKVQSTEASNAIEGIVTTNTRIKQLVEEKTTPKNRNEQEIAGYRDVLNLIHESFNAIPISRNYILQLHKIVGDNGSFHPGDAISRQDVAVILMRIQIGQEGIDKVDVAKRLAELKSKGYEFTDFDDTRDYARKAMAAAAGLIFFGDNNELKPQSPISRAETAQVMMNLLKK